MALLPPQPLALRVLAALCSVFLLHASTVSAQSTTRVSVDSAGAEGDGDSQFPHLSYNGRFVVFHSHATNLVPGDVNHNRDVFLHDRQTGLTTLMSVDSSGVHGNYESGWPCLSADQRYVAFDSWSNNLVPGDTNNYPDVFVRDRETGETTRVSVDSSGGQGNDFSFRASISADGRYVAFASSASNLVAGDTNGVDDVFVHNRQTGLTTRVSVSTAGLQGNANSAAQRISADGRSVVFWSMASTLVPGDTNERFDIFVHDLASGVTTRVSVDSAGVQGNGPSYSPTLSANGRFVAFYSGSTNLVAGDTNDDDDCFVHDRETGTSTRVSVSSSGAQGDDDSVAPWISAHGRFVAFHSGSTNLVPGDTNLHYDAFVHDRVTGTTQRISVPDQGGEANGRSAYPSISADGRFVAYDSFASNLVPGDTNTDYDVFVCDLQQVVPTLAATGSCPGPMTLALDAATPVSEVAFALGSAGTFTLGSSVCAGTVLQIGHPRFGPVLRASWLGTIVTSYLTTPAMCGRSVQALDLQTCKTSNTVVL